MTDSYTQHSLPTEISVIVPVYHAEYCLSELVQRLHSVLQGITADYEILLVDDGSTDQSWPKIQDTTRDDSRVRGLRLSRNFGQHYAISAGLDVATGNWIVVMDCDLQDPPEMIPKLYDKAKQGHSVVFARNKSGEKRWQERVTSRLFYKSLGLISKIKIKEGLSNFSIASRQVVDVLRNMRERLRFYGGMLFWAGFPYAVVDYDRAPRHSGTSSYTFWRRLRLAVKNVLAYSSVPLEYCTYVGLGIMLIAIIFSLFTLGAYFINDSAPSGWTSLALLIGGFGGFLSFQLGLIGLYIGQIMEETRGRPLYVVADDTTLHHENSSL